MCDAVKRSTLTFIFHIPGAVSPHFTLPLPILTNLLPYIHPILLTSRQRLARIAKSLRHDLAELQAKRFENQHYLPVVEGEADTVAVYDDDAGIYLFWVYLVSILGC